jgi:hypothetical protein
MRHRESDIERAACERIKDELGVRNIKVKSGDGFPDRMFLIPGGKPLIIEFKRPGEVTRPRQTEWIESLKRLGYDVEIHDTVSEAFKAAETALRKANNILRRKSKSSATLEPSQVPKGVDEVSSKSRSCRTFPRPRTGKN